MPQNIYDDPEFFAGYGQLPRSLHGLDAAAEWPDMRAMLPPVEGLRIVDLGCGYGWFCRWARAAGAATVLGLDVSELMLQRAEADGHDAAVTYRREDLDHVSLPPGSFDLVYSSLTLHYLADVHRLFREVRSCLTAGGHFVFSVEHPLFTAPSRPEFATDAGGRTTWPLDDYSRESTRTTDWITSGIIKHHRTIATYLNALVDAGLQIRHIVEWQPTADQLVEHPEWEVEVHRPPFLLVAAHATAE